MKIVWKGSLSFGLVTIPIKLYSAVQPHALGFTLVHTACSTPLKYHRWCPHCEKEVTWSDTSKALKTARGMLILTQQMIKKLRPETTQTVTIVEFIEHDALDPLYINSHYYVSSASSTPAYTLFVKALQKLNKIAIGRFVMHEKEYTCAIQPRGKGLLLSTLYYEYEIKKMPIVEHAAEHTVSAQELKSAEQLIEQLSVKKFDITAFKDTFAHHIKEIITSKKPRKKVLEKKKSKKLTTKPTLLELLHKSVKPASKASRAKAA